MKQPDPLDNILGFEHDVLETGEIDEEALAWDVAEWLFLKIERPTAQEIQDRLTDGHPAPVWVVKHRLPTHPLEYFTSTNLMLLALLQQQCIQNQTQPRNTP